MKIRIFYFSSFWLMAILQASTDIPSCVLFSPVQTKHVSSADSSSYTATVGIMPIYDKDHKCIASMSYVSYEKDTSDKNRPLTFLYAGGPGSSSLTENFLVSGPKNIPLSPETNAPILQDNPETWLSFTDLVYIDMVGTGWGKIVDSKSYAKIFTPDGDANTFSQFILSYLNETQSLDRKIYLMGESYGGFRTALVMNDLLKNFISLKGIILISPLLDMNLTNPSASRLVDYALFLPTFVRAAIYHNKLAKQFMENSDRTVQTVLDWGLKTYLPSLLLGDELSPMEKENITSRLSEYTGLPRALIKANNNRISLSLFRHNLIPGKVIDYIDARMIDQELTDDYGFYVLRINSFMSSQLEMYPQAIQSALTDLNVKTKETYINYFDPREIWSQGASTQDAISVLHNNLLVTPDTKLFIGMGYYDIDIPYYVTKTAIAQLLLPASIRSNITMHYYSAGHMFYTDPIARKQYYKDIKKFYQN